MKRDSKNLKRNDKGAALITVIIMFMYLLLLVSACLSIAMTNFNRKTTAQLSDENFIATDSMVDKIKANINKEVSSSINTAYLSALDQYTSDPANVDPSELFLQLSKEQIVKAFLPDGAAYNKNVSGMVYRYDIEKLKLLNSEIFDISATPGEVKISTTTPDGVSNIVVDTTNDKDGKIVFKDLLIEYTNDEGYLNKIETDLVVNIPFLTIPKFPMIAGMSLADFCLVADGGISTNSGGNDNSLKLEGSVYMGPNADGEALKVASKYRLWHKDGTMIINGKTIMGTFGPVDSGGYPTDFQAMGDEIIFDGDVTFGYVEMKTGTNTNVYIYGDLDLTKFDESSYNRKADQRKILVNSNFKVYGDIILPAGKTINDFFSVQSKGNLGAIRVMRNGVALTSGGTDGSWSVEQPKTYDKIDKSKPMFDQVVNIPLYEFVQTMTSKDEVIEKTGQVHSLTEAKTFNRYCAILQNNASSTPNDAIGMILIEGQLQFTQPFLGPILVRQGIKETNDNITYRKGPEDALLESIDRVINKSLQGSKPMIFEGNGSFGDSDYLPPKTVTQNDFNNGMNNNNNSFKIFWKHLLKMDYGDANVDSTANTILEFPENPVVTGDLDSIIYFENWKKK